MTVSWHAFTSRVYRRVGTTHTCAIVIPLGVSVSITRFEVGTEETKLTWRLHVAFSVQLAICLSLYITRRSGLLSIIYFVYVHVQCSCQMRECTCTVNVRVWIPHSTPDPQLAVIFHVSRFWFSIRAIYLYVLDCRRQFQLRSILQHKI